MFILVEACILCLIGINQFFFYQFSIMDLHKDSTGEYYNNLMKIRDVAIESSNVMNMFLGVLALFSLGCFIVYNTLLQCTVKQNRIY